MQTTLLGLGIAIIVALVAALIGPLFVNWGDYRGLFEARASQMVGLPVRIAGRIDARLLPVPSLSLRSVEVQDGSGGTRLKARELDIELALGALVRGEWRATEMRLVGPEIRVGLDAEGRMAWPGGAAIVPDSLSIERLHIENGKILLSDAARAARVELDAFWFKGDVRSLAGPFKGEGGFLINGERHGYRLNAGRFGNDGLRLRLALDPTNDPVSADADGTLRLEDGKPHFEGTLTLARTAAVTMLRGRAVASEPWRLVGRLKATPATALMEQLELQYGPEERAIKLTGTAEMKLGPQLKLEAVLSARQLDLDRLVGLPEGTRRLPLVALRAAADALGDALKPTIPTRIGIGVDAITVGGSAMQNVRGDVVSDAGGGWLIETLEFRMPGLAQTRGSGRLSLDAAGPSFSGPVSIEAADPRGLLAWLEGRTSGSAPQIGPLRATGELTLAADRIAVDRLKAEFDRKQVAGKVVYAWAADRRPRLEADLAAAELDLDAAAALIRVALPGASLDLPAEFAVRLDLGRATLRGIEAERVKGDVRLDEHGLVFERLTIGDLAGAALELNGHVEGPWTSPTGSVTLDFSGARLDGVISLVEGFAPQFATPLRLASPHLRPAKLRVALALERAATAGAPHQIRATARAEGTAGALRLAANATFAGDAAAWRTGAIKSELRLDASDGRSLARLLTLDDLFAVRSGTGSLRVTAAGAPGGDLRVDARLAANGFDLGGEGTLRFGEAGPSGNALVTLKAADALALHRPTGVTGLPVPMSMRSKVAVSPGKLAFDDVTASIAGATLGGRLGLALEARPRVDGRIDIDTLDASSLLAALIGMPPETERTSSTSAWPAQPFRPRFLARVDGTVTLNAGRAALTPGLEIRQLRALLRFAENEMAVEDVSGVLAGGRLAVNLVLPRGVEGSAIDARIALTGADIAGLLPGEARPPIRGRVSVQLEAKGGGRSPASLAGGLGGAGTLSVENVELVGFDPRVFEVVIGAVDKGVAIEVHKVKPLVETALAHGRLRVARADAALALTAGQLRVANLLAKGDGADLAVDASFDLVRWLVDARLALVGAGGVDAPAAGRPEIFVSLKGSPVALQRTIDVSALTGWLTLRAVDLQARRLEVLEAERQSAEAARAAERAAKAPPAAPGGVPEAAIGTPPTGAAHTPAPPPVLVPDVPSARGLRPGPEPLQERPDAGRRSLGAAAAARPPALVPEARPRRWFDLFGAAR